MCTWAVVEAEEELAEDRLCGEPVLVSMVVLSEVEMLRGFRIRTDILSPVRPSWANSMAILMRKAYKKNINPKNLLGVDAAIVGHIPLAPFVDIQFAR